MRRAQESSYSLASKMRLRIFLFFFLRISARVSKGDVTCSILSVTCEEKQNWLIKDKNALNRNINRYINNS